MNSVIAENLAQARAIQARADYDSLPADVKAWCESIIKQYGQPAGDTE